MNELVQVARRLARSSWPAFVGTVLAANAAGAIAVYLFVEFLLPLPGLAQLHGSRHMLPLPLAAYVLFATAATTAAAYLLYRPILEWEHDQDAQDLVVVRTRVMRIPMLQAVVNFGVWMVGVLLVGISASWVSTRLTVSLVLVTVLNSVVVSVLVYLLVERLVRPIAAAALARHHEDATLEPPVKFRLRLTWWVTSGIPIAGVLLLALGHWAGFFTHDAADILPAVLALSFAALVTGAIGTALMIMSVVDPILDLRRAISRVRRGDDTARVDIYDGSEIGVLQSGFNEMMFGLGERQRVRDTFGHYVGREIARRAIEESPSLGGEGRKVAVLFIDVVGSTSYAMQHGPEEVVADLNALFEKVVEVVHRHRGEINKFQGDAALAIFGAPISLADATSQALAAARELRLELAGQKLECGIGVSAGPVVAGHIGGKERYEYTVIGDTVNQAARLTDLAKNTPGRVLTSAATLRDANEAEQARWTLLKSVELRGRKELAQLARPLRETLAERS